jgi:uncharacterized protein YyaL (SSP411 family)
MLLSHGNQLECSNMQNALAAETSPYLRQHADNPVNWLPWSQQALDQAQRENKPILLSIGYSACHWCHVMAHESFEDETTAMLMNRHYVNIKVDREERPDLDRIYQGAHLLLTRRAGGWPLTIFLSPDDQLPFFAGTYFPNQPRHGMIAFTDLLQRIADLYQQEPDKIKQQGDAVQQALIEIEMREAQNRQAASSEALLTFDEHFLQAHDPEHGGLGHAPKFPQAAILQQALARAFDASAEDVVFQALDFSLRQIARGGIQDQVGGGFYRYSVDDQWMIPHFEKMLSDNGQLLQLFAQSWRLTGNALFSDAVEGIAAWLKREMTSPTGTFYAALDADSEGVEGKFYLWTPAEVAACIDQGDFPAFAWRYGLDRPANFEGYWHLHGYHDEQQLCARFAIDVDTCRTQQDRARERLLKRRATRPRPNLDDKVLTSWNALVIRGLANAARVFSRPDYFALAQSCLHAIEDECWQGGRLLAQSSRCGKHLPAYLDDYAHLLQAILDCLQYQWSSSDLAFALKLADQLLEYFVDKAHGGFFFTASDHEKLIHRPKSWQDEAMPSGNARAALALNQLGLLSGRKRYTDAAEKALQSVADNVNQSPLHAASFVALLDVIQHPTLQIIVRGDASQLQSWRGQLLPRLKPAQSAYFIASDVLDLPPEIADKIAADKVTAWVCEGFSCRAPLFEIEPLLSLIDE